MPIPFKKTLLLFLFVASGLVTVCAEAGEIEPRAYVNTPIGVNFLLAGYIYSDGGIATDGASPLQDAHLQIHTGLLAYARSLNIFGNAGKIDLIVPYANLSGDAMVGGTYREREVEGFVDPRLRFSVNFVGAPALSLEEFAKYRQDLIVGASVQISAPLGQYDKDRLVNLGNNRWYVKPDLGVSKAWGNFVLELSSGVFLFTENHEYFGGKELEQDPLYTGQLHATYNFGKGVWGALSGTYDYGGRTTVDAVTSQDLQSNSRVGATLALPVNRNNSVKLYGSKTVYTRRGSDLDLIGLAWQYRWGGGL